MSPLRLVVLGTVASNPYAGMAWMHMQIAAGLQRLGHEVWYVETTSNWPYDPLRREKVCDDSYAVPYLASVAERFGLGGRWAYRRSYSDKEWAGLTRTEAERLLAEADAVLNVAGSTRLREEGLEVGRLVLLDTDPVWPHVLYAQGDAEVCSLVDEHDDIVTYGENIGRAGCRIPELPRTRGRMRQPVLLDLWRDGADSSPAFTTVANWKQEGREVVLDGERYGWSKDAEFRKVLDLPRRVRVPVELAMNLARPETIHYGEGEPVKAWGVAEEAYETLETHGWRLVDAAPLTTDPWPYRDYLRGSRGEFSVARDLHVRLRSGWFSERSACYLAAGRPVITQDTGFGDVLPTGEGLLAWTTLDEAVAALEEVESDYPRHARAAGELAAEYFAAERVLPRMLEDLGL